MALRHGYERLRASLAALKPAASDSAMFAFCLAERADCFWYRSIAQRGSTALPGCEVSLGADRCLLKVQFSDGAIVHVLPGRQGNTAERLEWLSVGSDIDLPHRVPWRVLVKTIREQGGIPTLNWAPGKWCGPRRAAVQQVLEECGSEIMICDTTLRPIGWGVPRLMQQAIDQGIAVIRGSDPLPQVGEENLIGTYGSLLEWGSATDMSAEVLCQKLFRQQGVVIGTRSTPWQLVTRLVQYYHQKGHRLIPTPSAS